MSDCEELEKGRSAYSERRWADAFELLMEADPKSPLGPADLQLMARAAAMIGRDDATFAALERSYELCLADGKFLLGCQAAFWHGFRLFALGENAQATAWLTRAEQLVERHGADCAERGYLLLPQIQRHLSSGEIAVARELASEAAALGDRFGDPDLSAFARQLQGRALLMEADVATGLKLLDEAMLIATQGRGTELVRGLVYCSVIAGCQQVFAVDRAREWTAVLADWCKAQPQLGIFNGICRVHRAEIMQITGAWNEALREIDHLAELRNTGRFDRAAAAYQEAEIHRLRGQFAAAERAYERVSDLGGETQPGFALLRLAQGAKEAAESGIRRAVVTTAEPLRRVRYLPAFVEIMIATGHLDDAKAAAADLEGTARLLGTPVLGAMAAHASGSYALASDDAKGGLPLLQQAAHVWQDLDAPYLAARIRVEIASAYDRLGDHEGANLERTAARKVFRRLDARPDLERLELPEASGPLGPGNLSRREIEVLRLAASGQTNRSIAVQLGLSDRTVDRHISNILSELDVPSRAAATAYAYQHRLIGD